MMTMWCWKRICTRWVPVSTASWTIQHVRSSSKRGRSWIKLKIKWDPLERWKDPQALRKYHQTCSSHPWRYCGLKTNQHKSFRSSSISSTWRTVQRVRSLLSIGSHEWNSPEHFQTLYPRHSHIEVSDIQSGNTNSYRTRSALHCCCSDPQTREVMQRVHFDSHLTFLNLANLPILHCTSNDHLYLYWESFLVSHHSELACKRLNQGLRISQNQCDRSFPKTIVSLWISNHSTQKMHIPVFRTSLGSLNCISFPDVVVIPTPRRTWSILSQEFN